MDNKGKWKRSCCAGFSQEVFLRNFTQTKKIWIFCLWISRFFFFSFSLSNGWNKAANYCIVCSLSSGNTVYMVFSCKMKKNHLLLLPQRSSRAWCPCPMLHLTFKLCCFSVSMSTLTGQYVCSATVAEHRSALRAESPSVTCFSETLNKLISETKAWRSPRCRLIDWTPE